MSNLENVRNEIDSIDLEIVKLLSKRSKLVHSTVKFKNTLEEITSSFRVEEVIAMARKNAIENEISANMVDDVFHIVVDYMMELEINEFHNTKVF
jgi:isochorismate pyruvate lyase